jgi:Zn-dependent peptidase ImmA (M78 family)
MTPCAGHDLRVLARGFKSHAELLSEETRAELGLSVFDRLDPLHLAAHLEIPVWPLSTLAERADMRPEDVRVLMDPDASPLSAVTVFDGTRRMIVHNDNHAPGRQASNLCHELAHGLLLHPATPALDERGLRNWDQSIEDEATYLGATLLIPGKAARGATTLGLQAHDVARKYGCSVELANWRLSTSRRRNTTSR